MDGYTSYHETMELVRCICKALWYIDGTYVSDIYGGAIRGYAALILKIFTELVDFNTQFMY